jgi:hypothetical protein
MGQDVQLEEPDEALLFGDPVALPSGPAQWLCVVSSRN